MEALPRILRIKKLRTHIPHHIQQLTTRKHCLPFHNRMHLCVSHHLVRQLNAIFHAGLAYILMSRIAPRIQVLILLHNMMLSLQPSIQALLPSISIPHGQKSTQLLHRRHTSHYTHHLLKGRSANTHGLHYFGRDQLFLWCSFASHSMQFYFKSNNGYPPFLLPTPQANPRHSPTLPWIYFIFATINKQKARLIGKINNK